MSAFADRLIRWQKQHGRHDLPWQHTRDPYRVWLSEIMLQQTQVATVIPYYARFLQRFPALADLATAPVEDVMALWSGLGYYARARNLHRCAQTVMRDHGGSFPRTPEALAALPGIGRSTANSIATFCFGACSPILDGNVKRVFCRAFGIDGVPGAAAVDKQLWALAEAHMPARDGDIYNQAQMDLGATVCTRSRPRCAACPLSDLCVAYREGRQAELPARKSRRAVPEREVTLLVITDARGRVLLEARPPAGIWGGLQSLPELPSGDLPPQEAAAFWLRERLGVLPATVSPASTFTHTFTHFRLHIAPLRCALGHAAPKATQPLQWLPADRLARAALPAPVRAILTGAGLIPDQRQ